MHFYLFSFVLRFFQGKNIHLLENISLKCIDSLHPLWMIWPVVWSYPRIPVNFSQLYIGYGWSYVLECNIKFITPTPPNAGKLSYSQLKKYPKGKIMCWDIIHQDHKQKLKVNTCTKRSSELYNFAGSCILAQSMQTQGITRLGR